MINSGTRINIGTRINNYIVKAIANGYVLAERFSADPDPFVVWNIDADGYGVYTGRYFNDSMEAEWEFCGLAFEWFQDNVLICDVDDEKYRRDTAEARVEVLEENLSAAYRSLAAAMDLVEEMFAERERLCPKEDRITDEPIEKVSRSFAEDILKESKKDINNFATSILNKLKESQHCRSEDTFDTAMAMLDSLKARQMQRKEMLHDLNQAMKSNAPQRQDAEQIKTIKTLMAKMEKASNVYHSGSEY